MNVTLLARQHSQGGRLVTQGSNFIVSAGDNQRALADVDHASQAHHAFEHFDVVRNARRTQILVTRQCAQWIRRVA